MTKKLTILFLFVLLFSFFSLSSKEKYKIGFSQCTTGDDWRKSMHREMMIELAFYPDFELVIKDANDNSEQQINDIRQLLDEEIDLLIVSPNESEPITPIVEEVYNSGIPVIVIDRQIASEAYTAYVGANNYLIGKEAGDYAVKLLNGKGKIVEITGLQGSSPAINRHNGFMEVISQYPDIELVASESGKWNYSDSKTVMQNFLDQKLDFDLVFSHNDRIARAAYEIIDANNIGEKFILGIDGLLGDDGGIEDVIDGKIDATFLYPTGGAEAIQLAAKILNKQPFDRINILETVVIDNNNAKILKLQYEAVDDLQGKIEDQKSVLENQIARFKSQRSFLIVVLVLLAAIVILVIQTFRAYQNKRAANQKLELQKLEIEKRNQEIIKQRDQLIEVSEKLEEATQTKLRFFTNMSHEFRTPLTLIIGPLEDMIESADIPERFKKQVSMMHQNSLRLLHMINQLMDFRKIENNKMQLQATNYDIVGFLKDIVMPFYDLAEKKHISIVWEAEKSHLNAWFDLNKLDKVIFNLLSNAIKFTPVNGTIQITLKVIKPLAKKIWDEEVEIKVSDTGNGIPTDQIDHIFDRFYQAESSRGFMGTGLGLSLSKEFVDLHHGEIEVKSNIGEGTTFTIHLPTGNAHLSASEKIETPINETKKKQIQRNNEIHINPVLDTGEKKIETNFEEKPTVLLVEDENDVREYIKDSLFNHYHILEAENGRLALDIIRENEPDLIVSDIMMPKMDGLELTRTLKTDIKTCHIPIILLTAKASQEQKFEGLEEGADSYIPKPFNSRHLQIRVKKLLELRKKMQERYKGQLLIAEDDKDLSRLDRKFLNKISQIVEEHLEKEELTVEELSQLLGLSRVHVYRKIKKLTGMSVSEFVRSVKLKLSLNLIKTNGKTIAEIAYEVGFSSPSYFTKCFKAQFGISPSEFGKN
ncbi:ABC-type sugar transport system, substrate-binding protein, contains N-terminal xre family HTH domain [Draconibacterium orientale]|uniref:histidine kinase n=1 Tax=Draconibacterium orientale TaxID=1168034 RepID=X5DEQ3_9BACT|nr:substrate-binding domain-containing protein [Draconibacterium orientale]AHW59519.1 autoinducer kinase [Draconibacterium orientale]SES90550.1 ABC-type sugar transport system, substrate-binding protein, contains N-terminal xre family HTH domain [Draconibacterium orientale]